MVNWGLIGKTTRRISQRAVYDHIVEVIQLSVTYASDDIFRVPKSISSGVYNVPCHFEYGMREYYEKLPGGMAAGATAFLESDEEFENTFKLNRAYVRYESDDYEIIRIDKSTFDDSIVVHLKKR